MKWCIVGEPAQSRVANITISIRYLPALIAYRVQWFHILTIWYSLYFVSTMMLILIIVMVSDLPMARCTKNVPLWLFPHPLPRLQAHHHSCCPRRNPHGEGPSQRPRSWDPSLQPGHGSTPVPLQKNRSLMTHFVFVFVVVVVVVVVVAVVAVVVVRLQNVELHLRSSRTQLPKFCSYVFDPDEHVIYFGSSQIVMLETTNQIKYRTN